MTLIAAAPPPAPLPWQPPSQPQTGPRWSEQLLCKASPAMHGDAVQVTGSLDVIKSCEDVVTLDAYCLKSKTRSDWLQLILSKTV